jgi:hypothetical protein
MMERYEYRLEIAPQKRNRYSGLKKNEDAFAHTLMDTINETAEEGWEFLRMETMSEKRFMRREYMLYRRALRTNGLSVDDPLVPRRVKPGSTSNIEQLRARMHLATAK